MWRARLSWRSPPRLRRWRIVWPLEAGSGATPASRAKAASERTRPWCDQVTISCAATIGPTPGSSSSSGTSARTCEDLALELVGFLRSPPRSVARASAARARCELVGCARARAAEAAAASSSSPSGSRTQLVRGVLGCGHDHAAELNERVGRCRRRCVVRAAAPVAPLAAARRAAVSASGCECRAGGADRVERVVLAAQPPFGACCARPRAPLAALLR